MSAFWAKVAGGEVEACWLWTAGLTAQGYGRHGRSGLAHRVAYEEMRAEIPHGLQLDHLCRNRACVNPWHLEPVSQRENVRRGEAGLHVREAATLRTHCARGHEFTELNTRLRKTKTGWSRDCQTCSLERAKEKRPCSDCGDMVPRVHMARHKRTWHIKEGAA